MKYLNQLTALTLILLGTCSAFAEKTLLTPGKSWTVNERRISGLRSVFIKAKVEVCSDTVIDDRAATRLKFQYLGRPDEAIYYPCREDNGVISDCYWTNMMDFGLIPGEPVNESLGSKVTSINELDVNGRKFKELIISYENDEPVDSWVEGVGCLMGQGLINNNGEIAGNSWLNGFQIIDCSENGQIIFTQDDSSLKLTQKDKSDGLGSVLEQGRWWNLEVTLPDSSVVDAHAEIVSVEENDDKKYGTVKLECEGSEPVEFTVYDYNHRLFVKDAIDYPVMDLGVVHLGKFGRFYRFNNDRTKLELTDIEFGCGGSISAGPGNFGCMQNLIVWSDSEPCVTWAESIGASQSLWITMNGPQTILGYRMKECGQGNEVIFTSRDFFFTPSAINEVKAAQNIRSTGIYDLQGRRVSNPGRGLYIINGHKTLIR